MSSTVKFSIAVTVLVLGLFGLWFAGRAPDPVAPRSVPAPLAVSPPTAPPASVERTPAEDARSTDARSTDARSTDARSTDARAIAADPARADRPRTSVAIDSNGWRLLGSVRAAADSAPVPEARIDLWLRHADGSTSPLARTSSAADGAFAAELQPIGALDPSQLTGARVAGRVEAANFQPFEVSVPLATAVEKRLALDARLVDGAAVRGRAVDADEKPVPRATAAISIADGRSGPGGLTLVSEAEADSDGYFALGFSAERKLFLSVRADGVGVHAREIEVEPRRDLDVGDVVLRGGDALAGFVRHLDGTPVALLELWAIEGETGFKPDGLEIAVRRAREVERDDAGLSWSRTYTDAGGHFSFRGLRPDHFMLKSADATIVVEPRQGRWQPGQTNVELQVHTPLLLVRVVDEAGAPVSGALVEVTELGVEADGTYTPGGTRRAVARGSDAAASFSADPETPMAVRARLRGRVSPEKVVFFGQGTQHLTETLILAPRAKSGSLRLSVAGTPAEKVALRVALASPATGQRDEDLGVLEADAQGVVAGVPAGEHQLVVDFAGEAGAWFFPWTSRTPARVAPDAETAVVIEPVVGSRLAVRCELVGPPPKGFEDRASSTNERERFGARLVLAPAGGGPERTLDLRLGESDVYLILPGESAEARDLLTPGDWIVRVEGASWMSTETPIRLVAGRRMAATVEVRGR